MMQYDQAYAFLIPKLEKELSPQLAYHNADHTKRVIAAAEQLAASEKISGEELLLLKTAALFHDAGFLQQSEGHEEISCRMAREYLPAYGYSEKQISKVCEIIMATRLPQSPADHLGKILADADLFYLGKDKYDETAAKLYEELNASGAVLSEAEWRVRQVEFLSAHQYFTSSAKDQLEKQKQKTLDKLRSDPSLPEPVHHGSGSMEWLQDILLMIAGALIAAVALKLFLVPNHFFDGGITGISLLVHEVYHFNLGLVILVLNLPLIIVGYFTIGKRFAFRTLVSVILLGICLLLVPNESQTKDKLLIAVFGGAFLGIGIGLIMRTGSALDGIEVLAVYTLKRTSFTISEIILGINIIIFTIAGFRFGLETALYSILTYFTATRCIDYVVEGLQAYTGVTIVSGKSEAIKYQLVNKLGRGITVYKGERGFLPGQFDVSAECDIIFTVITRLELRKLKNLVYEVDPKAFVFANTIKEASGGIIKRRHAH
jgi:uncharacterized membrane-anchored protein YitT (DUF2179 family)/predicted metal-dependent HD superfamily phosphohydrolase